MIRWSGGWCPFDDPKRADFFLHNFEWEVQGKPWHPLDGKELRVIGSRQGFYDFILFLPEERLYAYAHLTWITETHSAFFCCVLIDGDKALNDFLTHDAE